MATKTNTTINGKDYFRIQRVIGRKDGKPVRKSFYGKSEAAAIRKYDKYKEAQIREKYERNLSADLSTFSERADTFIEEALKPSQRYAQGTKTRYISSYNTHIKGTALASKVATEISASDIQQFYNDLDVSQSTIRQIHKFMSAFYKWLALNNFAPNVLPAVTVPIKKDTTRHEDIVVWTDDEIKALTGNLEGYRLRFLIILLLYTGARVGEALALKYSDFDGDTLHIKRQYFEGEIKKPKSNSVRDIPLHEIVKRELAIHKAWHNREMKKNGYKTDYVFTTESGKLIDKGNLRRSLERFYKRCRILPKHTHAYRSTFCTQLCRCGVPLEVASKILGHKNIQVTAKHYAFVQPETKQEAIKMLHY